MQLSLILEPAKSPVLHGENGYYRKGGTITNASMYYSYTRLNTKGTITLNGTRYEVTGQSWMDHEFGTDQLEKDMAGWDWFSLQFADNTELMLYQLRKQDSTINLHTGGTFVGTAGKTEILTSKDFTIGVLDHYTSQKTSGTKYPSKWKVRVPKLGIEATVTPLVQDQELAVASSSPISYWEGLSEVKGLKNGKPISGKGYVELTGYRKPIGNRF
ncbi:MAG: hypothetical protein HGB19_02590 [Chlorobiales bacterium]|nr:hypothetical protein [Chlorobiales bacterium]